MDKDFQKSALLTLFKFARVTAAHQPHLFLFVICTKVKAIFLDALKCAKLFCRPSFQSAPPQYLEKPLRSLTKNCKSTKVAKDEICRATVPKDYMKKKL